MLQAVFVCQRCHPRDRSIGYSLFSSFERFKKGEKGKPAISELSLPFPLLTSRRQPTTINSIHLQLISTETMADLQIPRHSFPVLGSDFQVAIEYEFIKELVNLSSSGAVGRC